MSAIAVKSSKLKLMQQAQSAFASGDLATAERICSAILASAPGDGPAWCLLTETALLRGRPDAAIVAADRAVAALPSDPMPRILRAKCLLVCGEARAALEAAEAAAQRIGDAPAALDALGAIFGLLGRHRQARQLLQRAVNARPDVPQYLFNLAATERMVGALAEAEDHCDAAIALDRHYGLAHYLRSDLRVQTAARNHIEETQQLIREGRLSPPDQVMLRFALAKQYEDLDRHAHAFDQVEAGCELHRRTLQYDHRAELAEIDRMARSQDRSWLAAVRPGFAAAAPVFVAGLPRTGTTLVERIIASHPATDSCGETGAFATELRRTMTATSASHDFAALGQRYVASVSAFRKLPGRFVDKTLQNYLYCGFIHAALPQAKIILLQRHPLDACWAIYKAHFRAGFSFSYHPIELAEYYLAYRRLCRHWRATLPPQVLMEINYEDIVRDQEAASRRLIGFAGLPWNDAVLRFHLSPAPSATASAVQIRRPVYASSVGKWRHHAERLAPLRARLAQEIPEEELR